MYLLTGLCIVHHALHAHHLNFDIKNMYTMFLSILMPDPAVLRLYMDFATGNLLVLQLAHCQPGTHFGKHEPVTFPGRVMHAHWSTVCLQESVLDPIGYSWHLSAQDRNSILNSNLSCQYHDQGRQFANIA